jgi:hypothetical protein
MPRETRARRSVPSMLKYGPEQEDAAATGCGLDARPSSEVGLIRLSVAETARLARLAAGWAAGLLTRARLAFGLRWSAWRRQHQAAARWYHHATRLAAAAT